MGTKITNLEFEQLEKDNESEEDEEEWFDAAELQVELYNSEEGAKMEDVGNFKLGYAQAKQQLQKVVHNTESPAEGGEAKTDRYSPEPPASLQEETKNRKRKTDGRKTRCYSLSCRVGGIVHYF